VLISCVCLAGNGLAQSNINCANADAVIGLDAAAPAGKSLCRDSSISSWFGLWAAVPVSFTLASEMQLQETAKLKFAHDTLGLLRRHTMEAVIRKPSWHSVR
jgi:hypothetical protein